jgi:lipoprotein-releasing system ATP-binding protein
VRTPPNTAPALSVFELRKAYPGPGEDLTVLDGVTLTLEAGKSIGITGPSGSGKSTLLYILGTLEPPTSGRVELDGENPFELPPRRLAEFRNQKIGFVFQDHHLLPQCTALENVLVPTLVAGGVTAEKEGWARQLLDRVGLSARLDHVPAELSGGEKQRVAIARALIHKPMLLLCDEPTGNLDSSNAATVRDLFLELHGELQNILVVVSHSLDLVAHFDRRVGLCEGRVE